MCAKSSLLFFLLFVTLNFAQKTQKTPPPPPSKDFIYYDSDMKGVFAINKEYKALDYKLNKNDKTGNIMYVDGISTNNIIPLQIVTTTSENNQGNLKYDNINEYLKKIPSEQREKVKKKFYENMAFDIKTKYNIENLSPYGSKKNSLGQYYDYFSGYSTKENYIFVFAIFRNNFKVHNLFLYYSRSGEEKVNIENQKKVESYINNFWIYDNFK